MQLAQAWPTPVPKQYPEGIRKYDYDPSFAIRGLHYDIQKVSGKATDSSDPLLIGCASALLP